MTRTPASQGRPEALELASLARAVERLDGVRRGDLLPGDRLLVATRNSLYSLEALEDGGFVVSGGFFLRTRGEPVRLSVTGCTAGGCAIFTAIVAAPGLYLEFADGTRTTRILGVRLLRAGASAAA